MEPAFFSAYAALAGSAIGGLTSLAASWLTQHVQLKAQRRAHDIERKEDLYKAFIHESSKLYADAWEHGEPSTSKLVGLYALVSQMRVVSGPQIIESADQVMRVIVATYLAPNKTLADVPDILNNQALNPLRDFSEACRDELGRLAST